MCDHAVHVRDFAYKNAGVWLTDAPYTGILNVGASAQTERSKESNHDDERSKEQSGHRAGASILGSAGCALCGWLRRRSFDGSFGGADRRPSSWSWSPLGTEALPQRRRFGVRRGSTLPAAPLAFVPGAEAHRHLRAEAAHVSGYFRSGLRLRRQDVRQPLRGRCGSHGNHARRRVRSHERLRRERRVPRIGHVRRRRIERRRRAPPQLRLGTPSHDAVGHLPVHRRRAVCTRSNLEQRPRGLRVCRRPGATGSVRSRAVPDGHGLRRAIRR
jgi:hypothetical protein